MHENSTCIHYVTFLYTSSWQSNAIGELFEETEVILAQHAAMRNGLLLILLKKGEPPTPQLCKFMHGEAEQQQIVALVLKLGFAREANR
jgi:hypothetical protein